MSHAFLWLTEVTEDEFYLITSALYREERSIAERTEFRAHRVTFTH